jgi:hypothetical protein
VTVSPNVVCLHEQDNGIGWKHTNWRTGRAVVTRHRELVVQFIITLANYEVTPEPSCLVEWLSDVTTVYICLQVRPKRRNNGGSKSIWHCVSGVHR